LIASWLEGLMAWRLGGVWGEVDLVASRLGGVREGGNR